MDKQLPPPEHWTVRNDGSAVTQRGTELPAPTSVVEIHHKGSANELLTHYVWVMELRGSTVTCRFDDPSSNRNSFRAYKDQLPSDLDLHKLARQHTIDPVGSRIIGERFGAPLTWGAVPMTASRRPTIKVTLTGHHVVETWLLEPVAHHREAASEHFRFGGSRYDGYRSRANRSERSLQELLEDPFAEVDPYSVELDPVQVEVKIDNTARRVEFTLPGLEANRPEYRFLHKGPPFYIQGAPVSLRDQPEWSLVKELLERLGLEIPFSR